VRFLSFVWLSRAGEHEFILANGLRCFLLLTSWIR